MLKPKVWIGYHYGHGWYYKSDEDEIVRVRWTMDGFRRFDVNEVVAISHRKDGPGCTIEFRNGVCMAVEEDMHSVITTIDNAIREANAEAPSVAR